MKTTNFFDVLGCIETKHWQEIEFLFLILQCITSRNGQTHFKNIAATFKSVSDHFGTLCSKGLKTTNLRHFLSHRFQKYYPEYREDEQYPKLSKILELFKTTAINPLSANSTKCSNTLKQFIGCCRRIV